MNVAEGTSVTRFAWPAITSAYVHIPFCRHRCGYCNFSVIAGRDDLADRVLNAIDRELMALDQPLAQTCFLGGGTPTHLNPPQLERLLQIVRERFMLAPGVEFSVEANPEDITVEKLKLLRDAGVNRISLGVQSFNGDKLRILERTHDRATAQRAVELCAEHIANVSLDLIFAAPNESLDAWQHDLTTATSLPISHLSTYTLTYEKGTSFWGRLEKGSLQSVGEETEVAMYQLAREITTSAGLQHYEISNFAKFDSRCRHNLAYWSGQGWYAAGPGAARFVDGRREVNHRSTTTYLKRMETGDSPTAESEIVPLEQLAREVVAFGVRMMDGICLDTVSQRFALDAEALCARSIEVCVRNAWVTYDAARLKLTKTGLLFADSVASELLGTR